MPTVEAGPVTDVHVVGSWFNVELDNGKTALFTEVSGLSIEMEVVESKRIENGQQPRELKRPGTVKYGEITLKRPLGPDKSFWEWSKMIRDGSAEFRTNGAVVMFDITGQTELGRWSFTNGWPSKWSASDLDVGSDDVMTEEITVVVEYLMREK